MQSAKTVLSMLKQKSKQDETYTFERLYRNLFNETFFLRAYQKLYPKEGNMTPGIDNTTIDGFSKQTILKLIELLKEEHYWPKPSRRTYIPKKNGKLRPLGIPCFEDKLVQEVIREILEAIYEPIFCECSHGFRPNRSCHTALNQIKRKSRGATWAIEGDITRCFENIDHDILINLLSKKIDDGRLLVLIQRFLEAGHFEFKVVHNSLSGTPQGNGLSPILANIYLHTFDLYLEELSKQYSKGTEKHRNPLYKQLISQRQKAIRQGDKAKAMQVLKQMQTIPSANPMDELFIRVHGCRYADDFLVCVTGSRALACEIKEKLGDFLKQTLKLELNQEKTSITNLAKTRVRFLGYELSKSQCNTKLTKDRHGHKRRSINGNIQLLVPGQVIRDKLEPFRIGCKPYPCKARSNLSIREIFDMYNAEIRGLYEYYCLATDVSKKLTRFKYFHYGSLLKTIAGKERSSVMAVVCKYGVVVPRRQGTGVKRIIGVQYETKAGSKTMTYFDEPLVWVKYPPVKLLDFFGPLLGGGHLLKRFRACVCELCGSSDGVVVHHVRKLKEVKQRYCRQGKMPPVWAATMLKIRRKTLVVCHSCHAEIHSVKL